MIAKIVDGKVVYPQINPSGIINGHLDNYYLTENGFSDIPYYEIENINKLERHTFTKLQIRRTLRFLGKEDMLDYLLQNETFKKDWSDAIEIDLNDAMTKEALEQSGININEVKLAMVEL